MLNFSRFFTLFQYKEAASFAARAGVVQHRKGFTLLELMVTISIFLVMTSLVVFRFISFDSTILLKTLGYDIALSIRTAQASALSVQGSSGNFQRPYGVSFTPSATGYPFYRYTGSASLPYYDVSNTQVIDVLSLGRGYTITDVCVVVSNVENCTVNRLDITYKRPENTSLFYALDSSNGVFAQNSSITAGIIKIQSTSGTTSIEVGLTGYVTVEFQ